MLTVSRHALFGYCLCTLTVPRGTDSIYSALARAIPTLVLDPIPVTPVTEYPAIRPDIKISRVYSHALLIQIDTTDTHFTCTFRNFDISEDEPVRDNLRRVLTDIQAQISQ